MIYVVCERLCVVAVNYLLLSIVPPRAYVVKDSTVSCVLLNSLQVCAVCILHDVLGVNFPTLLQPVAVLLALGMSCPSSFSGAWRWFPVVSGHLIFASCR